MSARLALVAPLRERLPEWVSELHQRLLDRDWDAHLVLDAEDPELDPDSLGSDARVHLVTEQRRGLLRRRRAGSVLRDVRPDLVHFLSAEHARRLAHLAEGVQAPTITRVEARDVAIAVGRPGCFEPLWECSDVLEVPADGMRERLRWPADKPAVVLRPFVASALLSAARREPRDRRPLRVLSADPLDWTHGYEHGVEAVALLVKQGVPISWRVLGDGEYLASLSFAVRQLGVGAQISVEPSEDDAARHRELLAADVYLSPANADGVATETLEALAAGLPVVACEAGELAPPASAAPLLRVRRRDPHDLAGALHELALDAELRARLGAAARRWATSHLRLEDYAGRLSECYRELAGSTRRRPQDERPLVPVPTPSAQPAADLVP